MTHDFWDFIEKYLPDYHTSEEVIRQSELQQYIDGNDSSLADELEIGEAEDELHLILYNLYIKAIDAYSQGLGIECEHCNIHKTKYCPYCGKRTDNDIIEDPFRCEECGSLQVQELAWVDTNTQVIQDIFPVEERDRYCNHCENHTHQLKESELLEDTQSWWEHLDSETMEAITSIEHASFINDSDQDQTFATACNKYWEELKTEQKIEIWKQYNYDNKNE